MEALALHPYVMVFTFDSKGPKSNVYKKYKDTCVSAFFTLDAIPPETVIDSDLNWNAIILTNEPQRLQLADMRCFQKWAVMNLPGFEVQSRLEQAGVQDMVGIVHCTRKEVLLLDVVESDAQIADKMCLEGILRHVTEEDRKLEANIEITSRGLKELRILDALRNVDRIRSVNLWENRLTSESVAALMRFRNVV